MGMPDSRGILMIESNISTPLMTASAPLIGLNATDDLFNCANLLQRLQGHNLLITS